MIGHGVSSFSSHSCAAGRTVPSAKPCTQSRMSFWSWFSSREKRRSSVFSCSSAALVAMSPRGGDAPRRRRCRSAGPLGQGPAGRIAVAAVHAHQSPHDEAQEARRQGQHGKVTQRGQDRRNVLLLLAPQFLLVVVERDEPKGGGDPGQRGGDEQLIEGGALAGLGGGEGQPVHLSSYWALPPLYRSICANRLALR